MAAFESWHASEPDVVWQSVRAAALAVSRAADVAAEQAGFTYLGGRDITGFIDGTANPQVRRAADVALVPPGAPGRAAAMACTSSRSAPSAPGMT